MSAIVRNALIGVGAVSIAVASGVYGFWYNLKTEDLRPEQKGSLLKRVAEVADAFLRSKLIADPYTAERHPKFVASLSSRESAVKSDRARRESENLKTSYYGYVARTLNRDPGTTPPIFRYDHHLPIYPSLERSHQGFAFAGRTPQIHDSQARDDILRGNYVRCPSALNVINPNGVKSDKLTTTDVIITGTSKRKKCNQFKHDFLRDVAYLAASRYQSLTPEHPYLGTPVFECYEDGIKHTGDLTDMSEETKNKIRSLDFIVFPSYSETSLNPREENKEVGAIVAGATKDSGIVCSGSFIGYVYIPMYQVIIEPEETASIPPTTT